MKKLIAMILTVLTVCSLAACGNKSGNKAGTISAELPNPFVDCDTLDAAAKLAGFELAVPETVDGYKDRMIEAIKNKLIQVIYKNGDSEIYIRKGIGSHDIRGDYRKYDETNSVAIGDLQVTFKGSNGKVHVATWTNGDYSYAVLTGTDGAGLDKTAMTDIINSVDSEDSTQMPNPFVDCDTLDDAVKLAGFEFVVTETVDRYADRTIEAIENDLIQAIYTSGDNTQLMLRKVIGTDDVSGDYNTYGETNTVTVGNLQVTRRQRDDQRCYLD